MKKAPMIIKTVKKRASGELTLYPGTNKGPRLFTAEYMVIGQLTVCDMMRIWVSELWMLSKL